MSKEIDEMRELTPSQRLACNLSAAGIMVLAGLFLLLCGLDVINVKVTKAICGTLLFAVGLMFLVNSLVSRNSVSFWLSFCFFVPALVELLVKTAGLKYSQIYPLYIAIPAVASLFTMFYTREWISHLPVIGLFGVPAAIFSLNSSGVAKWSVVISVLVIYIGLLMVALAIKGKKKDDGDEF